MKKGKIKQVIKNNIFGFILGALIFGTIGVSAATYYNSKDVTYDNKTSGMSSNNVQDAIDELYQIANPPAAIDTIKDLVSTNTNELYTDDHNNIRYYGKSPNNYVSFNNELWRIIGVIDGKIKIIRNSSIGDYKWASNGKNNWNNSDLKSYLNGEYYNSIESTSRNMISTNETFYLGGSTSSNYKTLTASGYYDAERSGTVYSGNPTTTTQSIGLMYPSDYGYAAGSSCLSTALYNYDSSCKNSDYLFSGVSEWLQAPSASHSSLAAFLDGTGYVNSNDSVTYSTAVRPVLYLKSDVKITGGDGSQNNAFKLG